MEILKELTLDLPEMAAFLEFECNNCRLIACLPLNTTTSNTLFCLCDDGKTDGGRKKMLDIYGPISRIEVRSVFDIVRELVNHARILSGNGVSVRVKIKLPAESQLQSASATR